jgi:hypothetical protein
MLRSRTAMQPLASTLAMAPGPSQRPRQVLLRLCVVLTLIVAAILSLATARASDVLIPATLAARSPSPRAPLVEIRDSTVQSASQLVLTTASSAPTLPALTPSPGVVVSDLMPDGEKAFPVELAPPLVAATDTPERAAEVQARIDGLLLRAMREDLALSPSQRETLKNQAIESQRKYQDTLDMFPPPTSDLPPSASQIEASVLANPVSATVCYYIITGRNSHADRVQGLHHTLEATYKIGLAARTQQSQHPRRVVWFSDQPDELIKPVVLRSEFEDRVCRENLAVETQMKGCRYQRNFYRALDASMIIASAVLNSSEGTQVSAAANSTAGAAAKNETDRVAVTKDFRDCAWFVKLSDDTVIIREHLEWLLANSLVNPHADAVVIGKVEKRPSYQFLSGGHPVIMSRAAMQRWGGRDGLGAKCEGTIIDYGPPKLKKFWWWADDVLTSFCYFHGGLRVLNLAGAFSVNRFRQMPLPAALWRRVGGRNASTIGPSVDAALPISYHTYPYATPRQMFSLWHWLHRSVTAAAVLSSTDAVSSRSSP